MTERELNILVGILCGVGVLGFIIAVVVWQVRHFRWTREQNALLERGDFTTAAQRLYERYGEWP